VTGFVRVENLFDRVYEEVTGYGTAGRSLYAGLTASF
jgi:outer membrane cobalamin receptor